jgi:hypothetical protein
MLSIIRRLAKASIVSVAALLVLSALVYGGFNHRFDVVVVTTAELLLVGSVLVGLRSWRTRAHRPRVEH